jgi:hypothetical protein
MKQSPSKWLGAAGAQMQGRDRDTASQQTFPQNAQVSEAAGQKD